MLMHDRRRALMMQTPQSGPGYITDGLVFHLDCLDGASASQWVDKIGGMTFSLTDCSIAADGGVVFNGTSSKGVCASTVDGVTIECVYTADNTTVSRPLLLRGENHKIMLYRTSAGRVFVDTATQTKTIINTALRATEIISATRQTTPTAVLNGAQITTTTATYAAQKSISGFLLGHDGGTVYFSGKIYALRLYDRALSIAEMQANQAIDNQRYGLGLTFPT